MKWNRCKPNGSFLLKRRFNSQNERKEKKIASQKAQRKRGKNPNKKRKRRKKWIEIGDVLTSPTSPTSPTSKIKWINQSQLDKTRPGSRIEVADWFSLSGSRSFNYSWWTQDFRSEMQRRQSRPEEPNESVDHQRKLPQRRPEMLVQGNFSRWWILSFVTLTGNWALIEAIPRLISDSLSTWLCF